MSNMHKIVTQVFCPLCGEEAEVVADEDNEEETRILMLECRGTCPVIGASVIIPNEVYDDTLITRSNWAKKRGQHELIQRLDGVLRDLKTLVEGE